RLRARGRRRLTRVAGDVDDLDGNLTAIGGRVGGLLADLQPENRLTEGAGLAIDVQLVIRGDLTASEQEDLFAASDHRGHDGTGLDNAAARRSLAHACGLEQRLQAPDTRLLLTLLIFGGMVAAVLFEVA